MSSSQQSLLSLVSAFRMSELQSLLMFAGKSKAGKKTELQARAAQLVKLNTSDINIKIQELSNNMYRQDIVDSILISNCGLSVQVSRRWSQHQLQLQLQ